MKQRILVIHDVMNYYSAEKAKKMQYASWKTIVEIDPYWIVPHAFKTQDIWLYHEYRDKLHPDARKYWDTQFSIYSHTQEKCVVVMKKTPENNKYCTIL